MPATNLDPDHFECYSDHAHDIRQVGRCEFCGSDDPTVVGHVLPHVKRMTNVDPVKAAAIVMKTGAATFFDGVLLDHFSASAVQAVYNALSAPNQTRLRGMSLAQAVTVSFALVNKRKPT